MSFVYVLQLHSTDVCISHVMYMMIDCMYAQHCNHQQSICAWKTNYCRQSNIDVPLPSFTIAKFTGSPALTHLNCSSLARAPLSHHTSLQGPLSAWAARSGGQPSSWSPDNPHLLTDAFRIVPCYGTSISHNGEISQAASHCPLLARSTCGPRHGMG